MPLVSTIIKHRRLLTYQPSTKLLVVVLVWFWLVRLFQSLRVCRIAFGYCWNRSAHACHSAWNLESVVISDPSPSLITYLLPSMSSPRLGTCTCTYRDSIFSILRPHSPLAVFLYFDQSSNVQTLGMVAKVPIIQNYLWCDRFFFFPLYIPSLYALYVLGKPGWHACCVHSTAHSVLPSVPLVTR